jgi:hypothetical protein
MLRALTRNKEDQGAEKADAFKTPPATYSSQESAVYESPTALGRLPGFIAWELSEVSVEFLFCDAIFESLRPQRA